MTSCSSPEISREATIALPRKKNVVSLPADALWTTADVAALFELPFNDLLFRAQQVHREHHEPNTVQLSTLLSIKTGGCAEDCGYCSQSAHHDTGLPASKLMELDEVLEAARAAKAQGASRFCMGAAWREPKDRDMEKIARMVSEVKSLGMETCVTLGMLKAEQAQQLKEAGLDYYNHNVDTSPEHYGNIIGTRTYEDRLETLAHARNAGLHVCSGGILGMGETRADRASMIAHLAALNPAPESVPINHDRGGPHHDAEVGGAALGRSRADGRGTAGVVLPGRRQLHLLRRPPAHHVQPAVAARPRADGPAGPEGPSLSADFPPRSVP